MKTRKPAHTKVLRVRITPHEDLKLDCYAAKHGVTVSHVIREYIRRLPRSQGDSDASLDDSQ